MKLYLFRHAEAIDSHPDERRPLSKRGHEQMRKISATILNSSHRFDNIVKIEHSPYLRAVESAHALRQHACLDLPLESNAHIIPSSCSATFAASLEKHTADRLIVSHNPFLLEVVSQLLYDPDNELVNFIPVASCIVLHRHGASTPSARYGAWRLLEHFTLDECACA